MVDILDKGCRCQAGVKEEEEKKILKCRELVWQRMVGIG